MYVTLPVLGLGTAISESIAYGSCVVHAFHSLWDRNDRQIWSMGASGTNKRRPRTSRLHVTPPLVTTPA